MADCTERLRSAPVGQGPGPNTATLGGRLPWVNGFGLTSAFYSPVAPDLKGAYTTQFGGGIQYEVLQDLTVGVDYLGRRIGNIIEDMSSDDGTNYYIANPTVSAPWTPTAGPVPGHHLQPEQRGRHELHHRHRLLGDLAEARCVPTTPCRSP